MTWVICEKEEDGSLESKSFMHFFGCFGKTRNKIVIEDDVLVIQKLKSFFVCFLWFETKLFIKDGPSTLVGFIDWLGSH